MPLLDELCILDYIATVDFQAGMSRALQVPSMYLDIVRVEGEP